MEGQVNKVPASNPTKTPAKTMTMVEAKNVLANIGAQDPTSTTRFAEAGIPELFLTKLMEDNVYVITNEQLHNLLKSENAGYVAIMDLRDPYKDEDDYASKIKGAVEFPIKDDGSMPMRFRVDSPKSDERWNQALTMTSSPLPALAKSPILVVHCFHSTNRTPIIVSGFLKNIAIKHGQKVVILRGGFGEYKKKFPADLTNRDATDNVVAKVLADRLKNL